MTLATDFVDQPGLDLLAFVHMQIVGHDVDGRRPCIARPSYVSRRSHRLSALTLPVFPPLFNGDLYSGSGQVVIQPGGSGQPLQESQPEAGQTAAGTPPQGQ